MSLLLWIFLGVMGAATAATVWAVLRAKDGYEDETGFHLSPTAPETARSARPAVPAVGDTTAAVPRQVATGMVAPEAALPSGLIGAR